MGYKGLQEVRRGYIGLQGFTRCYRRLQEITGGYKGLQGLGKDYRNFFF